MSLADPILCQLWRRDVWGYFCGRHSLLLSVQIKEQLSKVVWFRRDLLFVHMFVTPGQTRCLVPS